ncbi:MAG: glycosyltransferase family 4 protein [Gemmatimonadetes bacterium]|nr:glycosyltransferase family 4 protein [Gemmatimonadota bacterium]
MSKPAVLAVSLFSSPGAVADNFHTLARSLARQCDLSIVTSRLIADRPVPALRQACYLDFTKSRPLRWLDPRQWAAMIQLSRRRLYDLLFLYSEHPLHVLVDSAARARRMLFWCLDPAPHSQSATTTATTYEVAKRVLMRRADRVVVACDALRRDVTERYRVPPERVITSFHGTLDNLVYPDLETSGRDIDVLFFGRLESYKGVDVLVEAVRILRARPATQDLRVTIAGTGPFRVPPAPGTTLLNRYVPDRDLAQLVARARVVVMPYRDATGSQVPQTAFTYGTPVIASAVGCLSEYVRDGMNGLLVPPNDPGSLAGALQRLLGDTALWAKFSAGAREAARETFSNDTLTAQLLSRALE